MFRTTTVAAVLSVGVMVATATAATPFGGDDTGFVPVPKSDIAKCEAKTSKAVSKLISCIIKCHDKRASGKLADDTAENMCEEGLSSAKPTCKAAFAAAIAKLTGCPACINATSMVTLANTVETVLDANNGSVYCSSPSGAFLQ